jgi:DNA-binding response OmpR family regulator
LSNLNANHEKALILIFSSPVLNASVKSILVVDDDSMLVELISLCFERHGFGVLKAYNGLDAWNFFINNNTDLVLTDLQMPGLSGRDLSRRIRNQSEYVKIAIMTGGENDVAAELLKDGTVDYFFPKPFKIKSICKLLIAEAQVT